MTVRTRFAPSPTGFLHIGGARTALFNWLFARHHKGSFVLRVEDTDVARSTEESIQAILDGMSWLGLDWDEGPHYQSKRFDIYRRHAYGLLDRGLAYRCYCTQEELAERREAAKRQNLPPKYDGRCRTRDDVPDLPSVIRFKTPEEGTTKFMDLIKGGIAIENSTIEDLVILRSDDTPTYNFCVVVDDAEMEITHCIRGDDHIMNTPKQLLMYDALEFKAPKFAHLPMILGSDKARLSKRHGATSVTAYRDMGYLPHALVNYLARLGWSHGDQEVFSLDELVEKFTLEGVGKSSGVFNPEKLLWLNHHYIKETPDAELAELVVPYLTDLGVDPSGDARLPRIAGTLKERAKTLKELAESSAYYFADTVTYDEKAARKFLQEDKVPLFEKLKDRLAPLEPFDEENIEKEFKAILEEEDLKLGKLAQPVRVALTGGTVSPGIFELIEAMGKDLVLRRLDAVISHIKETAGA